MKIGRDPEADTSRVAAAREVVGPAAALFVDANGAYSRTQALAMAEAFTEFDVTWFEEPICSDDLEGLRLIRDSTPAGMNIAAGEYGYDLQYFRRMMDAGAVDIQQEDATRCAGITGFDRVNALCESHFLPLSAHTAPSIHLHPCCALPQALNLEYFYDHARIEHMLFDGAVTPVDGLLHPDLSRPGLGLEFKRADAARYAVQETRPPITGHPSGVLAEAGAALIAGAVAWELRIQENAMKSELLGAGGRTFAVVFDIGDEFIAGLTSFAKENDLAASHFTAIGSFSDDRLGYFQLERKEFKPIPINEQVEVLALVGNIALYQGEPMIHAHVVVGRSGGTTPGGHILEAHVRPTLEVTVVESPKHLQRTYNPDIGLALINLQAWAHRMAVVEAGCRQVIDP